MEITLTRAGEPELSFEDVFAAEYQALVQAMYLLCGDAAEAEDLAQEALARAFERWDRVRTMESPVGYVYRTALNLNRRRLRRANVLKRKLPWPGSDPEPATEVETRSDVMRALQALPYELRAALVLADLAEMSSHELGEVMGVKPSSARARLHRARRAFRDELGEGYE